MRYRLTVLSAVLASLVATPALAQSRIALPVEPILLDGSISAEEAQLEATLRAEEQRLAPQRAAFVRMFAQAYKRYPSIPAGTLEALAYVQSRWLHMQPQTDAQDEAHHRMPTAWGVMGLYNGQGFADQVGEAARLLGVSAEAVRNDPQTNILAAAALLDAQIRIDHPRAGRAGAASAPAAEDIRAALARYAGYSASPLGSGNVGDFARNSFAYDILLAMDRGVDDRGIKVPERAIAWERAFDANQLVTMRAPMVRLDVAADRVEVDGYAVDPVSETLTFNGRHSVPGPDMGIASTDYGPAIWNPAHSSNYSASRSASISAVTVHTTQGSYAGSISWFQNSSSNVSAHYVIRSSDGQVTQMVRDAHTAWHVGSQNSYTLGIEHEGYVNNASWYTDAMYNASAALVRHFCSKYSAITCSSAYKGAASSGINVLATSVKIKGHQHYSGQTHTDPGINWNWSKYYNLINPGSGGGTTPPSGSTTYLDRFESSVGHFATSPTYSGSTTGISTASTATRDCSTRKNGSCSLRVLLKDDTSTSASWAVRLLSGTGSPGSNVSLSRASGKIGFWVWSGGSGVSVGVGIDDSDGTERSTSKSIPANTWTYVSWPLADSSQWNAWSGGNGAITASSVTLDAIWLYHANTAYDINVYIDDVQVVY